MIWGENKEIEELARELIKITADKKKLEEREKEIKSKLLESDMSKIRIDNSWILRVTRSTVKLIENSEEKIMEEFPNAVKTIQSIDIDIIKWIPEAHKYLTMQETTYIQIKNLKPEELF